MRANQSEKSCPQFAWFALHTPFFMYMYVLFHLYRACEDIEWARYVDSIFSFSRPGIAATILYAVVETIIFCGLIWLLEVSPLLILKTYLYHKVTAMPLGRAWQDRAMQHRTALYM